MFANASSLKPTDESFGVLLEVEGYFDVAAEVGGLISRLDSEILDSECP